MPPLLRAIVALVLVAPMACGTAAPKPDLPRVEISPEVRAALTTARAFCVRNVVDGELKEDGDLWLWFVHDVAATVGAAPLERGRCDLTVTVELTTRHTSALYRDRRGEDPTIHDLPTGASVTGRFVLEAGGRRLVSESFRGEERVAAMQEYASVDHSRTESTRWALEHADPLHVLVPILADLYGMPFLVRVLLQDGGRPGNRGVCPEAQALLRGREEEAAAYILREHPPSGSERRLECSRAGADLLKRGTRDHAALAGVFLGCVERAASEQYPEVNVPRWVSELVAVAPNPSLDQRQRLGQAIAADLARARVDVHHVDKRGSEGWDLWLAPLVPTFPLWRNTPAIEAFAERLTTEVAEGLHQIKVGKPFNSYWVNHHLDEAVVLLGFLRHRPAVPVLADCLSTYNRRDCTAALADIGDRAAAAPLVAWLRTRTRDGQRLVSEERDDRGDHEFVGEVVQALGRLGDGAAVPLLRSLATIDQGQRRYPYVEAHQQTLLALARIKEPDSLELVVGVLGPPGDLYGNIREELVRELCERRDPRVRPVLAQYLRSCVDAGSDTAALARQTLDSLPVARGQRAEVVPPCSRDKR